MSTAVIIVLFIVLLAALVWRRRGAPAEPPMLPVKDMLAYIRGAWVASKPRRVYQFFRGGASNGAAGNIPTLSDELLISISVDDEPAGGTTGTIKKVASGRLHVSGFPGANGDVLFSTSRYGTLSIVGGGVKLHLTRTE